jgi:hypothetical protein
MGKSMKEFRTNNGYKIPEYDSFPSSYGTECFLDEWKENLTQELPRKMLIKLIQETLYEQSEGYLSQFKEFIFEMENFYKSAYDAKIFLLEDKDTFIVTDKTEKYP